MTSETALPRMHLQSALDVHWRMSRERERKPERERERGREGAMEKKREQRASASGRQTWVESATFLLHGGEGREGQGRGGTHLPLYYLSFPRALSSQRQPSLCTAPRRASPQQRIPSVG